MSFTRWWPLVACIAPLVWMAWSWRSTVRKTGLLLKGGMVLAILLALSEPVLRINETKMAVAVLVDTSASVPPEDLSKAAALVQDILRQRGRHWVKVLPFARATRDLSPKESLKPVRLAHTAGEAGRSTDLELAIREGLAALPAGLVPRLVVISDGKENRGSAVRAAWQARQLGVPVDTFLLPGRPKPRLSLESASFPTVAFAGERFPVTMVIQSPQSVTARIELSAESRVLGESEASLAAGENRIRVHAALGLPGAFDLTVRIHAGELGEIRFSQAVNLRQPRVLYVSEDPPGTEKHLLQSLAAARFEVTPARSLAGARFTDYQVVVLNNWDLEGIPPARKSDLEEYVKQGGGLLVIGGENNRYIEKKTKEEDPLERTLPAKLAPPRSPEGTCVVLIVDKSSSMEGRKIELARQAAIGVVENLRPIDSVGVLIFDNSFQWAVPIRRAEDKPLIKRLIAGIVPDGGTQIAPALAEAYRRILPQKAMYKHIVLLTDGISEEGDSIQLSREAAIQRVTISTVGLGQDVNRAYLERVAANAKGKSYFLTEPAGLEQILLKDVQEHTGTTAVEKPLKAEVLKRPEILAEVPMENAPPLKGYIRYTAKPTADVILRLDEKDPLLARWQYGLGRVVVFASDAKSRWAEQWLTWPGFDRFWANIFRDLLPHAHAGEATADFDPASGDLVVQYRLAPYIDEPASPPPLFAIGPEGFQSPVELVRAGPRTFRGRVRIDAQTGLFRVRPVAESPAFPEAGYYRPEAELSVYGADEFLLRGLAEFTGGRFQPPVKEIFGSAGRRAPSTMRLWPLLIGLAVMLNLAELFLRKWRGILRRPQ